MTDKKHLVRNTADEEQVRSAEKSVRLSREEACADFKFVMSSIQGRRVMWSILKQCGLEDINFIGSSESAERQGRQIIGNKLKSALKEAAFEEFQLMEREINGGKYV